jgi:hypothetical protein
MGPLPNPSFGSEFESLWQVLPFGGIVQGLLQATALSYLVTPPIELPLDFFSFGFVRSLGIGFL